MAGTIQQKGAMIIFGILNLAIGVYNTNVYKTWRGGGIQVAWLLVALGILNIIFTITLLFGLYKENIFLLKASYLNVAVWIVLVISVFLSRPGFYNIAITIFNSVMVLVNTRLAWSLVKVIELRRNTVTAPPAPPTPVKSVDNVYV